MSNRLRSWGGLSGDSKLFAGPEVNQDSESIAGKVYGKRESGYRVG